ncbi:MAG: type II toxin-antitoxin system PemK/MazF family toxin [Chitinophagaceae bacterium]|jgi:mRNA interferase MazF|nr:MAG: type II toxin-antitoxin system PemK/MazF family toxin [Chitinophagaceae bacterium]
MSKGDIILIPFPFSDLSGSKLRPAVVLIEGEMDLTVCFVTSQLKWQHDTDIFIHPDSVNGLKKNSLILLNKIACIEKKLALGRLGCLNGQQISELNTNLKRLLKLN